MQNVSRNINIKSVSRFLRLHNKHIILTPNFFDIDKKLNDYTIEHIKKLNFYLINCEFKIELNNNFQPHIKREYIYNTDFINMKRDLLYWIDYFMLKGY